MNHEYRLARQHHEDLVRDVRRCRPVGGRRIARQPAPARPHLRIVR